MKRYKYRLTFLTMLLAKSFFAGAQLTSPNLVMEERMKISGVTTDAAIYPLTVDQKMVDRKYFDGLGRPVEAVAQNGSPNLYDIVSFKNYSPLGMELQSYLPHATSTQNGSFHSAPASETISYYANGLSDHVADDAAPYAQTVLDQSPLMRPVQTGMYGTAYQPSTGHYKTINYRSNNSSVYANDALNTGIRFWNYDGTSSSVYPTGSLTVTELTDESGNLTISYADANGRSILKRQIISSQTIDGQTESCVDTYYVYDDLGELRVIIPPKALVAIRTANPSPWNITVTAAAPLVYQYNYDNLGRLIEKKLPHAGWNYVVYDPMNRPVLMQDGNMGASGVGKWMYTKYDQKGRVVSQGIYKDLVHTTRASMQTYVSGLNYTTNYYEEKQTGGTAPNFYTNRVFPTANQDASALQDLVYNYYDDYDFNFDGTADYSYTNQGGITNPVQTSLTRGMATGVYTRTLSNDAGTLNVWLHAITFYDKNNHVIQVLKNNHTNTAAADTKTIVPDFTGHPTTALDFKTVNGVGIDLVSSYYYDRRFRLNGVDQWNGVVTTHLEVNSYNEIGQLYAKKLHSTDAVNWRQNVDYRYDINGRLTSINNSTLTVDNTNYTNPDNNDLFGEEILYEKTDALGNVPLYNGNISCVKWGVNTPAYTSQRSYIFTYDQLNRLSTSYYRDRPYQSTGAWGNGGFNNEKVTKYDIQGNIEQLYRYYNSVSAPIDILNYTYSGNQLTNVSDVGTTAGFNGTVSTGYTYGDQNGNLTVDPKRGITLAYNILNKTDKISFSVGYIRYTYDAGGTLLRKEVNNGTSTTTTDYIDGFVYVNLTLSYALTPEGRMRNNAGSFVYEYFIRDHLGNVRVSFDGTATAAVARQENSYYPFGMTLPNSYTSAPANPNLFNGGSELQNDLGNLPEFYQTDNRNYDAQLGRFLGVDALGDYDNSASVYAFAGNNPVSFNDPTGLLLKSPEYWEIENQGRRNFEQNGTYDPLPALSGPEGWEDQFDQYGNELSGGGKDARDYAKFVGQYSPRLSNAFPEFAYFAPGHPATIGFDGAGNRTVHYLVNEYQLDLFGESGEIKDTEHYGVFANTIIGSAGGSPRTSGETDGDRSWIQKLIDKIRLPDYVSLNLSGSVYSLLGWNGTLSLDRYGKFYFSPFGVSLAKSSLTDFSASLTVNWLLQADKPTPGELKNFLSGHSVNFGGGYFFGGGGTWSPSAHQGSIGFGFYTPQIGGSYNYTPDYLVYPVEGIQW